MPRPMTPLDSIEKKVLRSDLPEFHVGDTVRVHVRIRESGEKKAGDKKGAGETKERTQVFEGVVLRSKKGGARAMLTVRKTSYGVGVERVFPVHSSVVEKIEVVAQGRVRRARLYYLRKRAGKAARIVEKREGVDDAPGSIPAGSNA